MTVFDTLVVQIYPGIALELDYHVNYMAKSQSWIVLEAFEVPYI